MASALLGSLGAGVPTVGGIEQTGMKTAAGFLGSGFQVGVLGLLLLAGAIPIAPFSFFGYAGLNLMAVGATSWAAGKAATQGASVVASKMLELYRPKLWIWSWVLSYSPWYFFDIVQLLNPNFAKEGFKIPFVGRSIGQTGGTGRVGMGLLAAAVGLFSFGGYKLMDMLPDEVTGTIKPILKTIFLTIGSATALAGGSIGAYAALPSVLSAVKGNLAAASDAAAGPSAPAVAPSVPVVLPKPPVVTPPTQKGGGASALGTAGLGGNPGSAIPSLREIADGLLGPGPYGDPAPYPSIMPAMMRGGGSPETDSFGAYLFLGTLAATIIAGLSLALVRRSSHSVTHADEATD